MEGNVVLMVENSSQFSAIIDALDAIVYVSDLDTYEVLYINQYTRDLFGDIVGKICWKTIQSGQTGPCQFCTNNRLIASSGSPNDSYVWEFQNTKTNLWFQCRDRAIPWTDGRLVRLEIATDITVLKRYEEEILQLAMTDQLTGLANRTQFQHRMEQSIKLANREKKCLALMILDLDEFKSVNDTYGHPVGDASLKAVASIFTEFSRETDVIVRLGGDEFAILIVHPEHEESAGINAQRIIDEIKRPINIMGHKIQIGISIGIALYPKNSEDDEELLKKADLALYEAKEGGRGIFIFYNPEMKPEE